MKYDLEKIFLVIVFGALLWAGAANLWDYRLNHEFPYGLLASDAFQHQARAEGIKLNGNYRYEPFYISGGFKDAIGFYAPVMYHLGIVFSYISGLETWDSVYLLVFIFGCLIAMIMYLIIKGFNKNVAILSIPLAILIFSSKSGGASPGPYAGFTWGVWPAYIGNFFLISVFWLMANFDLKKSYLLLAVFLSGLALAHTSEFVFAVLFIAIYLAADFFFTKKLDLGKFKKLAYAAGIFAAISAYYLVIFKFTYIDTQPPYSFLIERVTPDPALYLSGFGVILIFIITGLIFSLFFLKKNFLPIIAGMFMLAIGAGNYYGLGRHAFRVRTLWPIYLSIFFGLTLYQTGKFLVKKWKTAYSVGIGMVFLLLFIGLFNAPFVPHYEKMSTPGMMDIYHWNILNWFKDNTNEDSVVYFLYGDIYGQNALLRNAKRTHYLVNTQDYTNAINDKIIKRRYASRLGGDSAGVFYAYRRGLFSYGYHYTEEFNSTSAKIIDLCDMDYYVIDRVSRQPVIAQYNTIIKDVLVKNEFIEEVYSNEVSSIVRNNKPGQDCIPNEGVRLE